MSISDNKVVSIMTWMYAMWAVVNTRESIISKNFGKTRKRTKCHVGRNLIPEVFTVYGFTPPENAEVSLVFQKVVIETGILNFLIGELHTRECSRSVQDSVKIQSRSKILGKETAEEKVVKVKMSGKICIIFLLYILILYLPLLRFSLNTSGLL